MKAGRSLHDIFNKRSVRRQLVAAFGALVLFGTPGIRAQEADAVPRAAAAICEPASRAPPIPYDEQLLRQNDNQPPSAQVLAMDPEQRIQYYIKTFCFDAKDAASDTNPRDRTLIAAMDDLRSVKFMGKPLIDLAVESNLHMCTLQHMPAGTAAQYLSAHKILAAGPDASVFGRTLDLAHEILHASQDGNGLLNYGYSWDAESRVRRTLAVEAAPVAMEYAVAYEKKLEGDPRYWEYLKTHEANSAYTDAANHRLFEKTYDKAVHKGLSRKAALGRAAHAVFERVFQSKDWRDFYLDMTLDEYIGNLVDGKFREFTQIDGGKFGQDGIDKAGKVGNAPSFTAGGRIPAYEDFFKDSPKMRWAYEAVDLARVKQAQGDESLLARALQAKAEQGRNPYIGIDFAEVQRRAEKAQWGGNYKYIYEVMDDVLAHPAPHCDPQPAAPAAPDATAVTPPRAVPGAKIALSR